MRTAILLPTWIVVFLMQPGLPKDHPLKGMTLKQWDDAANGISVIFGLALWIGLFNSALAALVLMHILKF
jgi:hypothetical protein